uniref:Serpentine receptor class gamma n=2 Tax=Caenorhabditis japonica TaxID=281687 RepID=A0A8R1HGF6_CAEJA
MMQFILIICTVIITMGTTVVTFCKMKSMKKRIKASERSLCVAAGLISVGFLMEAVTQSLFAFFKGEEWMLNVIVYCQFTSWDVLTIGSPLVLLLVSHQFRGHVLALRSQRTKRVSSINNTITHHHSIHHTILSLQIIT